MIITLTLNSRVKQGDSLSSKNPSKLNDAILKSRLLLGSSAPKHKNLKSNESIGEKKSLMDLTKTERRPIFERIVEPHLDNKPKIQKVKLNKTKLKDEKSKRFRLEILKEDNISYEEYQISDKPIWKEVLDEQRSQLSTRSTSERIQQQMIADYNIEGRKTWPNELPQNKNYTFLNWIICAENIQATKLCEEIIDHTGYRFNPLLIMGNKSTGKSHLSWALGQAIQRTHGNSSVRLISAPTLNLDDLNKNEWSDTLTLSKALIIENIEELFTNEEKYLGISRVLEWAINIGVQVIITCDDRPTEEIPRGKLFDVISSSIRCQLGQYSEFSLVTMLRALATKRNVLLSDETISLIVESSDKIWPSCQSIFESVCMAMESGARIDSKEDIEAIIEGRPHSLIVSNSSEKLLIPNQNLAREIGKAAIEKISMDEDISENQITKIFDDVTDKELFKRPLVSHSGEPWFGGELPSKITSRVKDELETVSDKTLNSMIDTGIIFEQRASKLQDIENEMVQISNLIENSDTNELLILADRLIQLDSELATLKSTNKDEEINELDEYVPEGEWNIDENDVTIDELLSEEKIIPKIKRKAKKRKAKRKISKSSKSTKRSILIPVENGEETVEIKSFKTLVPMDEEE